MSGHNKWSTIKHKKAAADSKRGRAFSRISKEIMVAAKIGGGDVAANPRLRTAIASAKAVNMPNDNVDRAIKKGLGDLDGQVLEELSYEGFAAGGVAIMVDCLSDNRNRTAADIRNIFTKGNGHLGNTGSVAWMFQRKARFVVEGDAADEERLMELCFDAGVDIEDIGVEDEQAEVVAPPEAFDALVAVLESAGIVASESGLVRVPENQIPVSDLTTARQVVRLLDALEDYEDTQNVYANAEIDDALLEQLSSE